MPRGLARRLFVAVWRLARVKLAARGRTLISGETERWIAAIPASSSSTAAMAAASQVEGVMECGHTPATPRI